MIPCSVRKTLVAIRMRVVSGSSTPIFTNVAVMVGMVHVAQQDVLLIAVDERVVDVSISSGFEPLLHSREYVCEIHLPGIERVAAGNV